MVVFCLINNSEFLLQKPLNSLFTSTIFQLVQSRLLIQQARAKGSHKLTRSPPPSLLLNFVETGKRLGISDEHQQPSALQNGRRVDRDDGRWSRSLDNNFLVSWALIATEERPLMKCFSA